MWSKQLHTAASKLVSRPSPLHLCLCSEDDRCGGLYYNAIRMAVKNSDSRPHGILAIGVNADPSLSTLGSWWDRAQIPNDPITYMNLPADIADPVTCNFSNYRLVYLPSAFRPNHVFPNGTIEADNPGGITDAQNNAFISRRADLAEYINNGGSFMALTQFAMSDPYGFMPIPLEFTEMEFPDVAIEPDIQLVSPTSNSGNLDHNSWHGFFTGPQDWSGIYRVLVYKTGECPVANGYNQNCNATVLVGVSESS